MWNKALKSVSCVCIILFVDIEFVKNSFQGRVWGENDVGGEYLFQKSYICHQGKVREIDFFLNQF